MTIEPMCTDGNLVMSLKAFYLYGFSRPSVSGRLGIAGVDGRADVVELSVGNGVSAILSAVGVDELAPLFTPELPLEPDWIVPRAYQHERVVEAIMARSPVLPVRFGTIFSSQDALILQASGRCEDIARFLDRVEGLMEWSFKVFLEAEPALSWLLENDPELSERSRRMPSAPGARYFQEKALRDAARKRALLWARGQAGPIAESLEHLLNAPTLRLVPAAAAAPRERVLDLAMLLADSDQAEVSGRVESLAAPLRERGLSLEVSGPWPPYSFCPLFD